MNMRISICCILLLAAASFSGFTDFKVTKTNNTVVDTQALTIKSSFGQAINGLAFQQEV